MRNSYVTLTRRITSRITVKEFSCATFTVVFKLFAMEAYHRAPAAMVAMGVTRWSLVVGLVSVGKPFCKR